MTRLETQPNFAQALTMRVTARRAVKVSLVVGTLLILFNHGDLIAAGGFPQWWKIVLTYLVPYSVSSYSTAAFLIDLSRGDPQRTMGGPQ